MDSCIGTILKKINLGDYDQIITLFTREAGLLKLVVKGALRRQKNYGAMTELLTTVELNYATGREGLGVCHDIALLESNLQLRLSWENLQAAGSIAKALLTTQKPCQPSPLLYDLMKCYLTKIPHAATPATFSSSFQLKLLRHEGLVQISPHCYRCKNPALALANNRSACLEHAQTPVHIFTADEADLLLLLAYSQSVSTLAATKIDSPLQMKLQKVFENIIDNQ